MAVNFDVVWRVGEYGRHALAFNERIIGRGFKRAAAEQAMLTEQP
jgi:hypothetical protein